MQGFIKYRNQVFGPYAIGNFTGLTIAPHRHELEKITLEMAWQHGDLAKTIDQEDLNFIFEEDDELPDTAYFV